MRTRTYGLLFCILVLASLSLIVAAAQSETEAPAVETAVAALQDIDGQPLGTVTFTTVENGYTLVSAELNNLPAGFHGFHVHETGQCEDSGDGPFTAAGPHLDLGDTEHPDHAGDLPTLLVIQDGTAVLTVVTDRFTVQDLFDEDGSALIIHANADNFANIPERYGGPDAETLNAGDSGDRIACGVIEQATEENMPSISVTPEPTASG
jgi:superoxide dismutase, Cu-Zn family